MNQTNETDTATKQQTPKKAVNGPEASQVVAAEKSQNSPGVIILQWLSYAFWGWLILAIMWLVGIIADSAITGETPEDVIPYAIAATVVLLPIAFLTDFFYRKYEPVKKTGAAMVIMVVHAVLFALLAIGSLITTVFIVLSMLIGSDTDTEGQMIGLWVLATATVLYVLTLLRILNPFKRSAFSLVFGFGMLALTVLLLIWGIVGPTMTSINLRDDRRIESHLNSVQNAVSSYVRENEKLPDNLSQVSFARYQEEGKALVDDGLVRYKNDGVASTADEKSLAQERRTSIFRLTHRYQLCVTYRNKSSDSNREWQTSANLYRDEDKDGYSSYLLASPHPAGEVCYKLRVVSYDTDPSLVNTREVNP